MLSRLERLLAELKRRHVLRMAGLYAVGAWVVVQVVATTFPYIGLPQWSVTAVIIVAALGLPVTIVLAWLFELTNEGVQREDASGSASRPGVRSRLMVAVVLIAMVAVGAFALVKRLDQSDVEVDMNLAAVMPFRVAGGDATTAGLGEGMVDLLAMRLSDERSVRAIDARGAISAWTRAGGDDAADPIAAATAAARSLGAGRVITGSIVISGREVTIGASVTRTDRPAARAQTESVTGSLDSLLYLVDRLTVALLAREAGVDRQRLGGLTSLSALQAFLAGKAAHRRGQYREAIAHFRDALRSDSTFALAALSLNISARRSTEQFELTAPALATAFQYRDQLSPRDRALLHAFSPRHPQPASMLEMIAAFDSMLSHWPDDADAWFEVGDLLLHYGQLSGIDDAVSRSERAFHRAIALDSSFYLPLEHLLAAVIEQRDVERLRALLPRMRAIGGEAARTDYIEWRTALTLGDTTGARVAAARLDSVDAFSRNAIAGDAQWLGERIDDAERATAITRARAATSAELRDAFTREHDLALNRGMIRRAQQALEQLPPPATRRDLMYVRDALFSDGSADAAEAAAVRLRRALAQTGADTLPAWQRARVNCELAWWDLAQERYDSAAARRARIRPQETNAEQPFNLDDVAYCGVLIDASLALLRHNRDATALLQRADSINIYSTTSIWDFGNMITARLHERAGDAVGALSLWRRVIIGAPDISNGYISTRQREVARLALLTGDTATAREYYRRYITLRSDADPALQADLARARASLAGLSAEPPRR